MVDPRYHQREAHMKEIADSGGEQRMAPMSDSTYNKSTGPIYDPIAMRAHMSKGEGDLRGNQTQRVNPRFTVIEAY